MAFSVEMLEDAFAREFCLPLNQTLLALAGNDRVGDHGFEHGSVHLTGGGSDFRCASAAWSCNDEIRVMAR